MWEAVGLTNASPRFNELFAELMRGSLVVNDRRPSLWWQCFPQKSQAPRRTFWELRDSNFALSIGSGCATSVVSEKLINSARGRSMQRQEPGAGPTIECASQHVHAILANGFVLLAIQKRSFSRTPTPCRLRKSSSMPKSIAAT